MFTVLECDGLMCEERYSTKSYNHRVPSKKQPQALARRHEMEGT